MSQDRETYARIDTEHLEERQQAERPPLSIRWWVLPLALLLSMGQAVLNLTFENAATSFYLISTQICVIAFGFLMVLTLVINPLMRLWWPLALALALGGVQFIVACGFASAGRFTPGLLYAQVGVFLFACLDLAVLSRARAEPKRWQALGLALIPLMLSGVLLLAHNLFPPASLTKGVGRLWTGEQGPVMLTLGQALVASQWLILAATVAAVALVLRGLWTKARGLTAALILCGAAAVIAAVCLWKGMLNAALLLIHGGFIAFLFFVALRGILLEPVASVRPWVLPAAWPYALGLLLAAGETAVCVLAQPGRTGTVLSLQAAILFLAAAAFLYLLIQRRGGVAGCMLVSLAALILFGSVLLGAPAGVMAMLHGWRLGVTGVSVAALALSMVLSLPAGWWRGLGWSATGATVGFGAVLYLSLPSAAIAGAAARPLSWTALAVLLAVAPGLFLGVTAINHLLRRQAQSRPIDLGPFNRGEIMTLFAAMFVSAGISSFGLVDQLIPIITTPYNAQWNVPQRKWDKNVLPHLNPALYITDTARIAEYRDGFGNSDGVWSTLRKIPWSIWAKPLMLWMVFVGAIYLMFYSLSMLFYDTWARREKLVFPLARLPEGVIPDDGAEPGTLSSTYKSGLFWIGFIGVMLFLCYNGACQAGWIRGLTPLRYGLEQTQLVTMLSDSVFKGIADSAAFGLSFTIIFTAIGIGFLLPLEISRSLWVYYLLGIVLFLVAFWTAVGSSVKSFPSDWLTENNFASSLGAGGLLAFSATYVAKVGAERFSEGRAKPRLAAALWHMVRWDGLLFIASLFLALGWLVWSGVALVWALGFLAVVILVTIGLMRVVAEGGVYWFQIHVGPFHLAKMLGGAKALGGVALAPLMAVYSVLFLDIKTFMAPAVINSFKMQEETRASRRGFHLIVILSIVATVLAATIMILYVAYSVGGNRAGNWFFTSGPASVMDNAQKLVSGVIARRPDDTSWLFYLLGAGWVILSVLMRRRFFWWLHPIGFVMMANPLMRPMWFSFFIGWLCKGVVVKYGGRHMFTKVRPLFLGLLFGELAACFLWSILAHALGYDQVHIDLNRYMP